jgi:hypothetical protein
MTVNKDNTLYRVMSSPGGAIATAFLATVIFVAIFADWLAPYT